VNVQVAPKTRPPNRSKRFIALVFLVPVVLLPILAVPHPSQVNTQRGRSQAFSSMAADWQSSNDWSSSDAPRRPVFPYSVIPGGVRDVQELRGAIANDPVVAAHYLDFRLSKAHTLRLAQPVSMYVSYRLNHRVYWTRNPMTIPAGETLISDGENLARVRCGNRLSVRKADPVSASDPPREELDTPESIPPLLASFAPDQDFELFSHPSAVAAIPPSPGNPGGSGSPTYPPLLPPGVTPPHGGITPPPPVSTPEPGTWHLLFAGTLLLAIVCGLTGK